MSVCSPSYFFVFCAVRVVQKESRPLFLLLKFHVSKRTDFCKAGNISFIVAVVLIFSVYVLTVLIVTETISRSDGLLTHTKEFPRTLPSELYNSTVLYRRTITFPNTPSQILMKAGGMLQIGFEMACEAKINSSRI